MFSVCCFLPLTHQSLGHKGPITCQNGVKSEPCRREEKLDDWCFIQPIACAWGSLNLTGHSGQI